VREVVKVLFSAVKRTFSDWRLSRRVRSDFVSVARDFWERTSFLREAIISSWSWWVSALSRYGSVVEHFVTSCPLISALPQLLEIGLRLICA